MRNCGHADIGTSSWKGELPSKGSQGTDASRYVLTGEGDLIDVSDVCPNDRYAQGPYCCLACGNLMVPALGRTRKHHFKHKAGRPTECHYETYLHQLAKMVLFSAVNEATRLGQPYLLTRDRPVVCSYYEELFGLSCTTQRVPYGTDLAATFDRVEMEAGVSGFVADILLSSSKSGARMLLEIAVTHTCEETKISSGLPIVEIDIRSEDAANHLQEGIDAASSNTRCHNLPSPDAAPHLCKTPCPATGLVVLLYENGKAWYSEVGIGTQNKEQLLSDPRLVAHEIVDVQLGHQTWPWKTVLEHLGVFMIRQAFDQDQRVRSCLLCRSNGGSINDHDIYCVAKDRQVWMSSGAIGCTDYDPADDSNDARLMLGSLGEY